MHPEIRDAVSNAADALAAAGAIVEPLDVGPRGATGVGAPLFTRSDEEAWMVLWGGVHVRATSGTSSTSTASGWIPTCWR